MDLGASRRVSSGSSVLSREQRSPEGVQGAQQGVQGVPVHRDESVDHDLERLERAMGELVQSHTLLMQETEMLRGHLEARDGRIERLEADLHEAAQRRKNAVERVDMLILELEGLEAQLDRSTGKTASKPVGRASDPSLAPTTATSAARDTGG